MLTQAHTLPALAYSEANRGKLETILSSNIVNSELLNIYNVEEGGHIF